MQATLAPPSRSSPRSIALIQETFALSDGELGALFNVSRQAAQQWKMRTVPPSRVADVARVADLAQLLKRRLKPERLPQIVRTPGRGLQGRTVLEVLKRHGVEPVYEYLERLYSYSGL
ncbi:MAG: hypothetical protein JO018_04090 [Candidatus Eremiobacteraeota bacterium]|nr:hypothetical protein [Candidatus Eremiobacteraeota bacterium]